MSSINKNTCTEQGRSIPESWMETTLGKVSKVQTGPFGSQLKNEQYITGGTPVITVEHIQDFRIQDFDYPSVTEEDKIRLSKYLLKEGDIVFTRVGSVDLSAYVDKAQDGWMFSSRMLSVRTNEEVDSKFLSYFFRQYSFRKYIYRISVGATMPSINTGILKSIPISYPSLPEQKAIANILTAFDAKIENLQAQNLTLEQTAQTIFKEWFGKYQVGDELPDGWRVDTIDNLVELIIDYRGKTPKKLGLDWSDEGIPALSAKTIKGGKIVRRDALNFGSEKLYKKWMKDELQKGDILLTSEAPLGELYYLNDDTKYILSQRLFALRTNNKITSSYLYFYLFSKNGQHLLKARASGSTVQGIRQSELRKIEVIIPEMNILEKASNIFESTQEKKFSNSKQIQILKKTRDTLLPKLMSGQIRIKEFKD